MAKAGSLYVDLNLEAANFIGGMRKAAADTEKHARQISTSMSLITSSVKGAALGFISAFSIDAMANQIKAAADFGDAIVDTADKIGASTKFLQEFSYAAQMNGSSVETARVGLEKFAKLMGEADNGSEKARKTLAEYNITTKDIGEATLQAADGISKLDNRQAQLAATSELFGKKAADLTVTLAGGRAGISDMAVAAQQLGIVMEDDVLRNAGPMNDKLDQMKMILSAQTANGILQNADAIMSLANSFAKATSGLLGFIENMQVARNLSLQGGNPLNWDLGSLATGLIEGKSINTIRQDARNALAGTQAGREALVKDNNRRWRAGVAAGRDPKTDPELMSLYKQNVWLKQEWQRVAAGRSGGGLTPPPPGAGTIDLPTTKSTPAKAGPSAKELAEKELQRLASYQRDLAAGEDAIARARMGLSTSISDRADMEREMLARERQAAEAEIVERLRTGDLKAQEADALRKINAKLYGEATKDANGEITVSAPGLLGQAISLQEREELARQSLELASGEIDIQRDLKESSLGLARSSGERRTLTLQILDLEFEQQRLALERVRDSEKSSEADKAIANKKLAILGALQTEAQTRAKRETAGPLESYLDALPRTTGEINDALESIQVEALDRINDGLTEAIMSGKSLVGVIGDVMSTVVRGLIDIGLKQAFIKPLGDLLFGGGGGGGLLGSIVGGLFGAATGGVAGGIGGGISLNGSALPSVIPTLGIGARANGGYTAPGIYRVGERGEEIIEVGSHANVVPNHALKSLQRDAGGQAINVHIGSITSNDPEAVRGMVFSGIMEAMPIINQSATEATMRKLGRPRT
ncbi:hypothetical protein SAMN06297144_1879 [Sphingomonas guangdongensis]|uniref:Uncharacterized protein n=1 Tax=Sphingomonas guangdongensis TaxID=1141890 RepID=A0A285QXS7_9SPHN|nr:hypothetical protein [Sphingomonas guangdongensis]SOB86770.1 hypothetical protein SAMN06297144_1879 [Sphingomonas guangdongensis]